MQRILVKSVYDAVDYVLDHYYPFGLEEEAPLRDEYAVISIQDTHTQGFGLRFEKSASCRDVLTLYFDDIERRDVEDAVLFDREQALQIISFLLDNCGVETLLIHCYGGESRSRAVGAFSREIMGTDCEDFAKTGHPNRHVYDTLIEVWEELETQADRYCILARSSAGEDRGGSQCYETVTEEILDITPEMMLVENGRFAGVRIREPLKEYNGHHLDERKAPQILRVSAIGTAAASCRSGDYFANDDRERWNITEYTLRKR